MNEPKQKSPEKTLRTLNISKATWKRIAKDKIDLDLVSHEDVILHLYAIVTKMETADKLEVKR